MVGVYWVGLTLAMTVAQAVPPALRGNTWFWTRGEGELIVVVGREGSLDGGRVGGSG